MNISVPKKVLLGLCAATLFQILVLGGELLAAVYPRWTGVPIRVAVEPVDPRDLFRGNYARLNYAFSRVDAALWQDAGRPVPGQRVYVQIEQDNDQVWVATAISARPPSQGLFLRGRYRHFISGANLNADGAAWQTQPDRYRIEYGIEAWFAPKEKAQYVERQLRDGAWATVYVTDSGKAALAELELSSH